MEKCLSLAITAGHVDSRLSRCRYRSCATLDLQQVRPQEGVTEESGFEIPAISIIADNPRSHFTRRKRTSSNIHHSSSAPASLTLKSMVRWESIEQQVDLLKIPSRSTRLAPQRGDSGSSQNASWDDTSSTGSAPATNNSCGLTPKERLAKLGLESISKSKVASKRSKKNGSDGRDARWSMPKTNSDSNLIYPKRRGYKKEWFLGKTVVLVDSRSKAAFVANFTLERQHCKRNETLHFLHPCALIKNL